jgi:hypothetical protein
MLIPYHSKRLLPLVVADSASSFYDTRINKKFMCVFGKFQSHVRRFVSRDNGADPFVLDCFRKSLYTHEISVYNRNDRYDQSTLSSRST